MINPWFKFYGSEYLSDPKIGSLTPQERSCWITLMCLSSTSSIAGIVEYLTVEVLLEKSGIRFDPYHPEEWDSCISILDKFERMKMIRKTDDGVIEILNWQKRQESMLTGYERTKRYRENNKDKIKARTAAQKAIKEGTLKRMPCEVCESMEVEAHHKDYSEENWLKVTWLCKKHHENTHHNNNDDEMMTNNVIIDDARIEKNRIEKSIIPETSSVEIPELIKSFETINPASKRFYGNTTQRNSCKALIEAYGYDRVKRVIEKTLPQTNGLAYFPTITTPLQLLEKWPSLESAIMKHKNKVDTDKSKKGICL